MSSDFSDIPGVSDISEIYSSKRNCTKKRKTRGTCSTSDFILLLLFLFIILVVGVSTKYLDDSDLFF